MMRAKPQPTTTTMAHMHASDHHPSMPSCMHTCDYDLPLPVHTHTTHDYNHLPLTMHATTICVYPHMQTCNHDHPPSCVPSLTHTCIVVVHSLIVPLACTVDSEYTIFLLLLPCNQLRLVFIFAQANATTTKQIT